MIFNSLEFWVFFAVVASAYFLLPRVLRHPLLLVASYFFYMRWNATYAVIIASSTVLDYWMGRLIERAATPAGRLRVLLVSLVTELGLLFTFKYWRFFHETVQAALELVGVAYAPPDLGLLLPVGISFYTFQGLSYTVDVYRGALPAERSFPRFALYIIFFPQLVAGPIERATHLLPQFTRDHRWDGGRVRRGLELCLWGLFKKVVIADRLAVYVDGVYGRPDAHVSATLLLATYAFAYQIYCDFSGYSDIAVGSARVLGFELMENFDRPYLATSLRDFWRRWHISLSTWLRDYLYVPLGGGRGSNLRVYRNLLVTMLLGGLWHGASLNFVVWGALHGGMLAVSRATLDARDRLAARVGVPVWLRDLVRTALCFHLVCFAWIFFRASTWSDSWVVIRGILRADSEAPFMHVMTFAHAGLGLLVLAASELLRHRTGLVERLRGHGGVRLAATYALLLGVVLLGAESGAQFIYFQF